MMVEMWQKAPNEAEKLIGITKLPLHQFHIAFHEANLMNHVMKQNVRTKKILKFLAVI